MGCFADHTEYILWSYHPHYHWLASDIIVMMMHVLILFITISDTTVLAIQKSWLIESEVTLNHVKMICITLWLQRMML